VILGVRNGDEHPFGRFIFKRAKCTQQSVWPFFHGRITERWKANQIKWHFSYAVFNITICCGVSSGIKTWSTISQLPRRNDI